MLYLKTPEFLYYGSLIISNGVCQLTPADFCVIDNFIGSSFVSPAALGGVGQEQLNNNSPPQKNLGEAQAGGQKGRGSGGRNFCPPASSGGGKAFPQFLRQQEGKTEKFSFP